MTRHYRKMFSCVYAFYKQATFGHVDLQRYLSSLRDAFKINAWMQISHLTADEAKEYYIEIINSILKK
jgi:acyl-CoA-binding protein